MCYSAHNMSFTMCNPQDIVDDPQHAWHVPTMCVTTHTTCRSQCTIHKTLLQHAHSHVQHVPTTCDTVFTTCRPQCITHKTLVVTHNMYNMCPQCRGLHTLWTTTMHALWTCVVDDITCVVDYTFVIVVHNVIMYYSQHVLFQHPQHVVHNM